MAWNRESRKQSVRRHLSRNAKIHLGAACAATLFAAHTSFAQSTYEWSVTPSGNWSVPGDWSVVAGVGTPPPVAGDTASFSTQATPAAETITLNGNKAAAAVVIGNTQPTTFVGAASGNGLTLTSGLTINSGAGAVVFGSGTISTPLNASGTINLTNNSSSLLTFQVNGSPASTGNTALTGVGASNTVNYDGSGYATFVGSIRGATAGVGNVNFNITGTGTVELAGSSDTFAGVNVSSGALLLNATNALGTSTGPATTLTLSGGAVASTTAGGSRTIPANISVAVTADSTFGVATLGTTTTFTGPVTLSNGTRTLHMVKNLYLSGALTNASGGLTIDGGGTIAISSTNNSWTTATTIINGTLNPGTSSIGGNSLILPSVPMFIGVNGTLGAGVAGSLAFASLSDISGAGGLITMGTLSADKMTVGSDNTSTTFSGVFSGSDPNGNGEFEKVGTGTLLLKATNSSFNGLLWVRNGAIAFTTIRDVGAGNTSLFAPAAGAINTTASGQDITDLPAGTLLSTIQLGDGADTGTLRWVGTSSTLNSSNRGLNLIGTTGGATLDASSASQPISFTGAITATGTGAKTLTLTGSNTQSNTVLGSIPDAAGGTSISLFKDGVGKWQIGGTASSYTGTTTVNAGTLTVLSLGALGSTTGGTIVNTGGGLLFSTAAVVGSIGEPITIAGPGTGTTSDGAITVGNNANVNFTQPVTLAGDATIHVTGTGTALFTGGITATSNANLLLRGGSGASGVGTVNGPVSLGTGGLTKDQTNTWILNGALNYSGPTSVLAGTLQLGTNLTTSSNVSVTTGTLQLASNGTNSRIIHTGAVAVTGGQIDLTDNKMITTTAAGAAVGGVYTPGSVQQMVHDGLASGAWTGNGIVTSQTTALGATALTTLAVATASDVGYGGTVTFDGQTVNGSDTLVMYTYNGDMNLNGQITGDDYARIDAGFASAGGLTGYENGDLNYDGKINADDYFIIDKNYSAQSTPFPHAPGIGGLAGVSAVPEPASLSLLGLGAIAGLSRRRRRN